jgi:hypothetical protein
MLKCSNGNNNHVLKDIFFVFYSTKLSTYFLPASGKTEGNGGKTEEIGGVVITVIDSTIVALMSILKIRV